MPLSGKRFDLVELLAITCFVAVATAVAWNVAFWAEQNPKYTIDPKFHEEFVKRYGPERFSSGLEEYIIRDFFQDRRDGIFVDVGAFHAREHNNTYRLERDLGWRGLALDANATFAPEYPQHRPRTRSSRRSSATPTSAPARSTSTSASRSWPRATRPSPPIGASPRRR